MANSVKESNKIAKQICSGNYRYLYGGKDVPYTSSLVKQYAKLYPSVYTPSLIRLALADADKGYRAIDCSGFVCKVLGIANVGSAQLLGSAVKKYTVTKKNAKEGMVLHRNGHVAYVGEGLKIYEAQSTATDLKVSDWEKRANAFTSLIVVKGSALANAKSASNSSTNTSVKKENKKNDNNKNSSKTKSVSPKSFNKKFAGTYKVTANELNLRTSTSVKNNSNVITVIPKGAKVKCYGYYTDSFYYVAYKGMEGYCSKKYLTK